jgi:hypothetical protein
MKAPEAGTNFLNGVQLLGGHHHILLNSCRKLLIHKILQPYYSAHPTLWRAPPRNLSRLWPHLFPAHLPTVLETKTTALALLNLKPQLSQPPML